MTRTIVLILLAASVLTTPAAAQGDYPSRNVRLVTPAPAGGGADAFARLVGDYLSQKLGQPFVIDNRPGGATLIGLEHVAGAAPDGYTLFLSTSASTSLHLVHKAMRHDVRKAFAPIVQIAIVPQSLVINPSVPAQTVREFIVLAKKEPEKLNYGSPGFGSGPHMAMEMFMTMAGINIQHIPYRGVSHAATDILGGRLSAMMVNTLTAKPHVDSGRMRMLGVTSAERVAAMPDVPTIAESGVPGYEVLQWFGLLAPTGVPAPIIEKLQNLILEAMRTPEMKEQLSKVGAYHVPNTAPEFAALINREIAQWNKVEKALNLKPN